MERLGQEFYYFMTFVPKRISKGEEK